MRFTVLRKQSQLKRVIIFAGAFVVFSVIAYLVGGEGPGVALLIASVIIVLFIYLDQGKVGWYYEIGDSSLTVRRTFKRYVISGAAVVKVTKTGWHGVMERVDRYRSGEIPQPAENVQIALGRLIGFSSIPIPIRGARPQGKESFVLVGLASGREYVLSPENPDQFVKETQRLMSRTRTNE